MLTDAELAAFERDGFVAVRGAVPADVVAACRTHIAAAVRGASGVDVDDPSTWDRPVVRIPCPETPPFAAAGSQPVLWEAYDQLLGPGRWPRARRVGGTVPVRFPHPDDPGDAGWHVDGSYDVEGDWWLNVASRERGLLALFLFDDVGEGDAPTELKVGSHRDVPPVLARHGETGASVYTLVPELPGSLYDRPTAVATGAAGDVFVCHPFLVHRATWPHRGRRARAVAQPAIPLRGSFALGEVPTCPVERPILEALRAAG